MPPGCVMKIPNVQSILVGGTSAKCNFQKSDGSFETSEVSALCIIILHIFFSCQCNKYVIFMFDRIEIVSKIGIIQMNWNTCQFTMLVLKIQNAVRISEIQKNYDLLVGKNGCVQQGLALQRLLGDQVRTLCKAQYNLQLVR